MTDDSNLLVEQQARIAIIRLNRPKVLNALNDNVMNELMATLSRFERDDDIGCVVLTGNERAFAAGADIAAMKDGIFSGLYQTDFISRNWDVVRRFRKPIVAAVSGYALGGGCELAMMCDVIIAGEGAQFGQPEITIGVIPGAGGTQCLPRSIGKAKAMDLCLTGRMMSAQEALVSGLISRVVADDRVLDEAVAVAHKIAGFSLPVVMMAKESVLEAFETGLQAGLRFERRLFHAAFSLHDQKEGMSAFLEKRRAEFKHC